VSLCILIAPKEWRLRMRLRHLVVAEDREACFRWPGGCERLLPPVRPTTRSIRHIGVFEVVSAMPIAPVLARFSRSSEQRRR
jgi:hypothetical protein